MNDDWESGWESTRTRQRQSSFDSTTEARVAWLEMALQLAHAAGALPRRRSGSDARVWLGYLAPSALLADTLASELEALGVTVSLAEFAAGEDPRIAEHAAAAARGGARAVWIAEREAPLPAFDGSDGLLLVRCGEGEDDGGLQCEIHRVRQGPDWLQVARRIVFGKQQA